MKKYIYFILFVWTIQNAEAQLDIALKAGGNLSGFAVNPELIRTQVVRSQANSDYAGGFQLGLSGTFHFSEKLNLLTEFIYAKERVKIQNFDYLNLPILIGYRLGNFRIEAGIELAMLLFHERDYFSRYIGHMSTDPMDLSIIGGGSYFINEKVSLNLRYAMGVSRSFVIVYSDENSNVREGNVYNRSIQLSLSYVIGGFN